MTYWLVDELLVDENVGIGIWPQGTRALTTCWMILALQRNHQPVVNSTSSLHLAVAYSLSILLSVGNDASNNHCCLLILFHISHDDDWHQWLYIEQLECNLVVGCTVVAIIHSYQASLLTIFNRSIPPYCSKHVVVMIPEPVQGLIGWLASTLIDHGETDIPQDSHTSVIYCSPPLTTIWRWLVVSATCCSWLLPDPSPVDCWIRIPYTPFDSGTQEQQHYQPLLSTCQRTLPIHHESFSTIPSFTVISHQQSFKVTHHHHGFWLMMFTAAFKVH